MSNFFEYPKKLSEFFIKNGELVTYEKNQRLVWEKDESDWVFFLSEGFVKASFSLPDGTQRIIGFFVPGHIFAQSGSFFNKQDGKITYSAETNVSTYRIKHTLFLKEIQRDLELTNEYLTMTLRNQVFLIDRVVYQGEKNINNKCIRWLIFMSKYYGTEKNQTIEIIVPITQEVIANFLGSTRESANACLGNLVKKNIISISKKHIIILDSAKLKLLLQ